MGDKKQFPGVREYVNKSGRKRFRAIARKQVGGKKIYLSKTFDGDVAAHRWRYDQEKILDHPNPAARKKFTDILEEYFKIETPHKKGARGERSAIARLQKEVGGKSLLDINEKWIKKYAEDRLKSISACSVLKELSLISVVLDWAKFCKKYEITNDVLAVKKALKKQLRIPPKSVKRRITDEIMKQIVGTMDERLGQLSWLALETAMRRGEICGVARDNVDGRFVRLTDSKSGHGRAVPLSTKAQTIVDELLKDNERLFSGHPDTLSKAFINASKALGYDFTFHQLRGEATKRMLAKGLPVHKVKAITGHRTLHAFTAYINDVGDDVFDALG